MDNKDYIKLQQKQMEIMDEIHRICVKNNIVYYIIGGTALGAVRHGGFIPWDLDIDIAMPRSDYDKFKMVCKTELDKKFKYNDFTTNKKHPSPHALVSLKNTSVIFRCDKFNKSVANREIYVDVFPLDTPPDSEKLREKQQKSIKLLNGIKERKRIYSYNNSRFKRMAKILRSLCFFWISDYTINKKLDMVMRKYSDKPSDYICSMASHYSYKKQCMLKEIYGNPQLVKFEDREYYAPEQIEKYLTIIYKDYMKLPPVSEQEKSKALVEKVIFND